MTFYKEELFLNAYLQAKSSRFTHLNIFIILLETFFCTKHVNFFGKIEGIRAKGDCIVLSFVR